MKAIGLPIETTLPELLGALANNTQLILQAPPGAGKSTIVPLALLQAPWLQDRKILLLEPRRLAARSIASRMAAILGEPVGQTVGYRMRMERKVGPATRLEVLTEGMLTRQLQADPELSTVGIVIFDEFHERSLQADLGLALSLEVQAVLREDLRILVMSATLDTSPLQSLLPKSVCITTHGRVYPVSIQYANHPVKPPGTRELAATIGRALQDQSGDMLVFLPGIADIRRLQTALLEQNLPDHTLVLPLYGDLPMQEQDRAIQPSVPGTRKIVLATNIAETSLTIEGVRIVIDSGWTRRQRFEPSGGMSRLETLRVSRASAEQRAGRAGRLGPGLCYRLWTEAEHRRLSEHTPAEILEADLAPLAVDLSHWGASDPRQLAWLDPPPAAAYNQACDLLGELGALNAQGRLTAEGMAMSRLAVHPRLAHMLLQAKQLQAGQLGCYLAAVLSERDFLRATGSERDIDLSHRVRLAMHQSAGTDNIDMAGLRRVQKTANHFRTQLQTAADRDSTMLDATLARLAACAYPDRLAKRRAGSATRYIMRNGKGAMLEASQVFSSGEYLVITHLDAGLREARIHSALPLTYDTLVEQFGDQIEIVDSIAWDRQAQTVIAQREQRLGALALNTQALTKADPEIVSSCLLKGIRELGLASLPWTETLREWQARVNFVGRHFANDPDLQGWPDVSDTALMQTLEDWLQPALQGKMRLDHIETEELGTALANCLTWDQRRRLDTLAPTHYVVPSGSSIALQYVGQDPPVLAVRLQELFGLGATPRIAADRVPLCLHLLSPAGRPVQITSDLAGFWANSYFEVRKDLRGRYPKHAWPDNPLSAVATRRTRKAQAP